MIHINNNITGVYSGLISVTHVYKGLNLVWSKIINENPSVGQILSCFYNGYWIDDYPWTDDTPWTD